MSAPNSPRKSGKPRHPAYAGRPKGVWYPDLVGVVPNYPPTLEKWQAMSDAMRERVTRLNAEGKMFRGGVPDGWAGRKPEAQAVRVKAHEEAKEIVKVMKENDLLNLPSGTDGERAELAFTYAAGCVKDATMNARDRLMAARMLADFMKAKPVTKSEVTVNAAEDFLNSLLAKE